MSATVGDVLVAAMATRRTQRPRSVDRSRRTSESEAELFGDDFDRLLLEDPELVRLSRRIRALQRRLRNACSEEAWRIYLALEAVVNARSFLLVDKYIGAQK